MNPEREYALKLAVEIAEKGERGEETVERARRLLDFIKGTRDAEIISAAHDLARKVG